MSLPPGSWLAIRLNGYNGSSSPSAGGGWLIEVEVAILQSKKGGKILLVNFSLRYCLADTLQVVNMLD